jgi:short-subunit dehydrogenase
MIRLDGAAALVTGASGGIGGALVARLREAGCDVLAVARNPPAADTTQDSRRGRLLSLAADLTRADDRQRVVAAARSLQRPLTLLVHAAACPAFGLLEDTGDALAERLMQLHVVAPLALTRELLPTLARQPAAAVVAVGSTFGSLGYPGFAAYSASKFALRGLFEALGREHADGSVGFLWLSPRATATTFNDAAVDALNRELKVSVDDPAEVADQLLQGIRGGRRRMQIGWPEKFFVRLNAWLPGLVDRALAAQLPVIRRHARPGATLPTATQGATP